MYANESYLIELLTQAGYLNEEILQYARSQKSPTQDLIDFLIQSNYLTEDVIAQVSASNSLLPVVDLGSMHIPRSQGNHQSGTGRRFRAIPISDDGFSVNVAIDDPLNLETMDSLPQLLGRDVIFSVATRSAVESRLKEFYRDMSPSGRRQRHRRRGRGTPPHPPGTADAGGRVQAARLRHPH